MINWGFLGASWVAGKALVPAVKAAPNANLYAVASRDQKRSAAFEPTKVHATYADLIADPKVDAVYISLANHLHLEWTIKALNAGKHVLCEKPLAITGDDAKLMAQAASANDRLLVEAIWTRWHPRFVRMVELVKAGEIGQLKSIDSTFTFTREVDDNYRLNPDQGGGSLLDVGPYQVHVWAALTDASTSFSITSANQNIGPTGVDLTTEVQGLLADQIKVSAVTSFEQAEVQRLVITGERSTLEFPTGQALTSWNEASSIKIGNYVEEFAPVDPFALMVTDFGNHLAGKDSWLPRIEESIYVASILDNVKSYCQN